jgi:hypothetical protein
MESFLNIDLMVTFRGLAEALRAEEAGLFVLWIAPDDDEPTRWLACLELPDGDETTDDPIAATFAALLAASALLRGRPGIVVHEVVHDVGFRRPGAPAGAPQPRRWRLSDGPPPTAFAGLEETLPAALVAQASALGDRAAFAAEEP